MRKQLLLSLPAVLLAAGCCGAFEPDLKGVKKELSAIHQGMPRDKALRFLEDHSYEIVDDGTHNGGGSVDATRQYGSCPVQERFFRCIVSFDANGLVSDLMVFEVRIPL